MNSIEDYLKRTESAVKKLFEANKSYWDLLEYPERPIFSWWGDLESNENKQAYEKWHQENKEKLELRAKKDNEFAHESFARTTLLSAVLQFAFWGIEMFSANKKSFIGFDDLINPSHKALKFCIGRMCEDIPIGLIIYAGRNQAIHFGDDKLNLVSRKVFDKLSKRYNPTQNKWYRRDEFDLDNPKVTNYAANITHLLEWDDYDSYKNDILKMFKAI